MKFSDSVIVGGVGGEVRIITQGGGKGTPILLPMLVHTLTPIQTPTLLRSLLYSASHMCCAHTHFIESGGVTIQLTRP